MTTDFSNFTKMFLPVIDQGWRRPSRLHFLAMLSALPHRTDYQLEFYKKNDSDIKNKEQV